MKIKLMIRKLFLYSLATVFTLAPLAVLAFSAIYQDIHLLPLAIPLVVTFFLFVPKSRMALKLIKIEEDILRSEGIEALKTYRKDNPYYSWKLAKKAKFDPTRL